jgi:hypothetical protein
MKELAVGEIGYGKVGRIGKDRHYTFVKDIEENMVFKEIGGIIYARWRRPLRKYTRTDGSAVPEMFFWLFDRVILNEYDYNGNYKLARKIRSTFRKERLEGRDYFTLKKDFSFVKKVIQAKYHELDRFNEIDRFRNMSRNALTNCLEASMKGKEGVILLGDYQSQLWLVLRFTMLMVRNYGQKCLGLLMISMRIFMTFPNQLYGTRHRN